MVSDDVQNLTEPRRFRDLSMRWPMRVVALVLLVVFALFFALWFSRERIADNVIASQLQRMGIPPPIESSESAVRDRFSPISRSAIQRILT